MPSPIVSRRMHLRSLAMLCFLLFLPLACGVPTDAVDPVDPLERAALDTKLPADFPEGWQVPEGWTLVDGIEDGEVEFFGASATWVSPDTFDDTLSTVETLLTSTGWGPGTPDELVENDVRDYVIQIDNGTVQAVRIFSSSDIVGILVTVDLPKR